jgi:predicted amidohydrolase
MPLIDFTFQLEAADSAMDLARQLGDICLENSKRLRRMLLDEQTADELEQIEARTGKISLEEWEKVVAEPSSWREQLGEETVERIDWARMRQPLDFLGVLRGLCEKALAEQFLIADGQLVLDKGVPVRFAVRPVNEKIDECTTSQVTANRADLLGELPYSLFPFSADEDVRVVLDFSHMERIDELTWSDQEGLPSIATIHREGSGEVTVDEVDRRRKRFFGVQPKDWDEEAVLGLLAAAKQDAEIAVLPELTLPRPGELQKALSKEPAKFPAIVVAGSAHTRDGTAAGEKHEIRSNESRIYLDGKCVAFARKHHVFATKTIGSETFPEPLKENLTVEQKTVMVLSGQKTRLAVVICADLIDAVIPRLLPAAGVNLLLVPAMTKKIGSFNPPICDIAGYCQGVAAIVNARWGETGKPFLLMLSVPREQPSEQSIAIDGKAETTELAIFNPNEPLSVAVNWK